MLHVSIAQIYLYISRKPLESWNCLYKMSLSLPLFRFISLFLLLLILSLLLFFSLPLSSLSLPIVLSHFKHFHILRIDLPGSNLSGIIFISKLKTVTKPSHLELDNGQVQSHSTNGKSYSLFRQTIINFISLLNLFKKKNRNSNRMSMIRFT